MLLTSCFTVITLLGGDEFLGLGSGVFVYLQPQCRAGGEGEPLFWQLEHQAPTEPGRGMLWSLVGMGPGQPQPSQRHRGERCLVEKDISPEEQGRNCIPKS